jgi:Purple acid Phosphatase, N-terminal domain
MSINPPGSGGFLHTHTPVDQSSGSTPGAPTYPNPIGASTAEWPTPAATGLTITVAPSAGTPGTTTATITWTTNRASDSAVQYGPGGGGYTNTVRAGALVTAHSVGLSGLTTGTLYHYRVSSYDGTFSVGSADATFTTA